MIVTSNNHIIDMSAEEFERNILEVCAQINADKRAEGNANDGDILDGMGGNPLEVNNNTIFDEIAVCQLCYRHGEGMGNLICPCLCQGGTYTVHDKCIARWVVESGQDVYHCNICTEAYVYKVNEEPVKKCQKLGKMMHTSWFQICVVFILLFVGCQALFPKAVHPFVTLSFIALMFLQMVYYGLKYCTKVTDPAQLTVLDRDDESQDLP